MIQLRDQLMLETCKYAYAFILFHFSQDDLMSLQLEFGLSKLCDNAHVKYRLQEAKELQHAVIQPLTLTNIFVYIMPYGFKSTFPFELCKTGLINTCPRQEEIKVLGTTVRREGGEPLW